MNALNANSPFRAKVAVSVINAAPIYKHLRPMTTSRLRNPTCPLLRRRTLPRPKIGPDVFGQRRDGLAQELRRAVDAGAVAAAQPIVGNHFGLRQAGDQRPMTRFEPLPCVARRYPFLMTVLMQQRPGTR